MLEAALSSFVLRQLLSVGPKHALCVKVSSKNWYQNMNYGEILTHNGILHPRHL